MNSRVDGLGLHVYVPETIRNRCFYKNIFVLLKTSVGLRDYASILMALKEPLIIPEK